MRQPGAAGGTSLEAPTSAEEELGPEVKAMLVPLESSRQNQVPKASPITMAWGEQRGLRARAKAWVAGEMLAKPTTDSVLCHSCLLSELSSLGELCPSGLCSLLHLVSWEPCSTGRPVLPQSLWEKMQWCHPEHGVGRRAIFSLLISC